MAKKNPPALPPGIRILGMPHQISWNHVFDDESFGEYDADTSPPTIKVGNRKVASSFLHEIVHGILDTSGMSTVIGDEKSEALCIAMENGLLPLIPLLARILRQHPSGS